MNDLANVNVKKESFSYRDLSGEDKWTAWTPTVSFTIVGTPTYVARYRVVGRQCFFQFSAVATTSVATTAGTSNFDLPITAAGLGGVATMTNDTTNIAVGVAHIDVAGNKCYPPSQAANAGLFTISGWYEI